MLVTSYLSTIAIYFYNFLIQNHHRWWVTATLSPTLSVGMSRIPVTLPIGEYVTLPLVQITSQHLTIRYKHLLVRKDDPYLCSMF